MTISSKVKSIIILIIIAAFIAPKYTQADEYKRLKSLNYNNIFVYSNFSNCPIAEKQLAKSLEGVLLRSRIQAFISKDRPVISVINEEGKHDSFLIHELVKNKKIFLRTYVKCGEFNSAYIYLIDVNFAIVEEDLNILIHEFPDHSLTGVANIDHMDTAFRKAVEKALANYLSANME